MFQLIHTHLIWLILENNHIGCFYNYSFTCISTFDTIAVKPPVVIPDENMFLMVSEQLFNISGMNSTLNPKEKLNAITSVAFLFIFWEAIIRIPAAATVPNISSVAPPRTGTPAQQQEKVLVSLKKLQYNIPRNDWPLLLIVSSRYSGQTRNSGKN